MRPIGAYTQAVRTFNWKLESKGIERWLVIQSGKQPGLSKVSISSAVSKVSPDAFTLDFLDTPRIGMLLGLQWHSAVYLE